MWFPNSILCGVHQQRCDRRLQTEPGPMDPLRREVTRTPERKQSSVSPKRPPAASQPQGSITPDATLKNAAAPKTSCQKYAGQNSAVRLWSRPAYATNRSFWVQDILKKKGKSTANTTIYSVSCVSMASAFSSTSDRAGVSWSRVSI